MITPRKSDHKFTLLLYTSVRRATCILAEHVGRDKIALVPQKLLAAIFITWEEASHGVFEAVGSLLRHGIPELGSSEMDVVDREKVHILDVPRKSGAPHSEVKIGGVDAGEALARGKKTRKSGW